MRMRRGFAILAILLVAETSVSAGKPCCCLRRFSERAMRAASVAGPASAGADAPEPACCCSHAPPPGGAPRSRLPLREPGCPCRTVEPFALVADAPDLPALDASDGWILPAPDLASSLPASAARENAAPCGSSPPGSYAGPPSSATPSLLPLLTI